MEEKKMVINANKIGIEAIQSLCDSALKVGGLQNLNAITVILAATKELLEENKQAEVLDEQASQPKIVKINEQPAALDN